MGKRGRRSRKGRRKKTEAPRNARSATEAPARSWPWRATGLAFLAGNLVWLGFAGADIWPFGFVAFVPFFAALETSPDLTRRQWLALSALFGFITWAGGYHWLLGMLRDFSGFPLVPCLFFAAVFWAYGGGQFVLLAWLWRRLRARGVSGTAAAAVAYTTAELVYPQLFPSYHAASFHQLPVLLQTAELGGPLLLTAVALAVNGALYDLWRWRRHGVALPRWQTIGAALSLVASLGYGAVRIAQVDAAVAAAPKLQVGLVQTSMGIFEKWSEAREGHRRHLQQTRELVAEKPIDLVVWPETAYVSELPHDATNLAHPVAPELGVPLLFGGVAREGRGKDSRIFNRAYLLDEGGEVLGTYDKTYLLAFGEYLPFGDVFPWLYDISTNTAKFTRGDHQRALPLGEWRLSALVCYEDILPGFVRQAVRASNPHLLVNITNDAWFGDSLEPWIHLALSKFRAVEHRRFLVRATNTGVSAVVDPVGRVTAHSGVFTQETVDAEVAMLDGWTPYQTVGDWPGWLCVVLAVWLGGRRRPKDGDPAES